MFHWSSGASNGSPRPATLWLARAAVSFQTLFSHWPPLCAWAGRTSVVLWDGLCAKQPTAVIDVSFLLWHFHGNCPVWGPISRSAWEWSRGRKNRTRNTVSGAEKAALASPRRLSRFLITGEEMETMTAGGGEGVDLTGLLQSWRQPHPPLPGCFPAVTRWFHARCLELLSFCFIWSHTMNEGSTLGMVLLGCSSWNPHVKPKVPTPCELFNVGVWLKLPL